MKMRKVFLEGFVELKRELFRTAKTGYGTPYVLVEKILGACE